MDWLPTAAAAVCVAVSWGWVWFPLGTTTSGARFFNRKRGRPFSISIWMFKTSFKGRGVIHQKILHPKHYLGVTKTKLVSIKKSFRSSPKVQCRESRPNSRHLGAILLRKVLVKTNQFLAIFDTNIYTYFESTPIGDSNEPNFRVGCLCKKNFDLIHKLGLKIADQFLTFSREFWGPTCRANRN